MWFWKRRTKPVTTERCLQLPESGTPSDLREFQRLKENFCESAEGELYDHMFVLLRGCDLRHLRIRQPFSLSFVDLSHCDLRGAILPHVSLHECYFDQIKVDKFTELRWHSIPQECKARMKFVPTLDFKDEQLCQGTTRMTIEQWLRRPTHAELSQANRRLVYFGH